MESRFNIPAPVRVKYDGDVLEEWSRRMKVAVPQGDVEALAKADSINLAPRKAIICSWKRPYRKPTQVGGHKCAKARE